jgi:glycosyltransferase involved in cell wall biosynthesis
MNKKSAIFIPVYNCEKQIIRVLDSINLIKATSIDKVIVIDNNSTDSTLANCLSYDANYNIQIISHDENYGLGGSFKTAYKYAYKNNYEYIYWFHGDDQAYFSDLLGLEKEVNDNEGIDCVFGARFAPKSILKNYSKLREYGNRVLNMIFSILLRKKIYELGSGLNAYKVSSLPSNVSLWPEHIAFDANLLFHFIYKNKVWYPITWNERDQVSNANNINVSIRLLSMLLSFLLTKKLEVIDRNSNEYKTTKY